MFKTFALVVSLMLSEASIAQTLLVRGDSPSAGYGRSNVDRSWVALLQQRLDAAGDRVINASIPGDTSAGGLARVPALLSENKPAVVVLGLGANDGLRALSPAQTKTNLNAIVRQSKAAGATVVLLGMRLPPNFGNRYTTAFEAVFPAVARESDVLLVPFFLDGVGGEGQYMQADGLHPNEAAQPILLENVWRVLGPVLEKHAATR